MADNASLRDTIARVAAEEGIDPAYALAVAERESSLNPNAGGKGTIRGLYQMTGANRKKYGQADDAGVEDQVRAFARFTNDQRADMAKRLGRDPTNSELYLGHYWGPQRAAAAVSGAYQGHTPGDVFTPRELEGNPNLRRYPSMDHAVADISADMERRFGKFGGAAPAGDRQAVAQLPDQSEGNSPSNQDEKINTAAVPQAAPVSGQASGGGGRGQNVAAAFDPAAFGEDPNGETYEDRQTSSRLAEANADLAKMLEPDRSDVADIGKLLSKLHQQRQPEQQMADDEPPEAAMPQPMPVGDVRPLPQLAALPPMMPAPPRQQQQAQQQPFVTNL